MRILITGGSGFLGTAVAKRLALSGNEVTLTDKTEAKASIPGTEFMVADISDMHTLKKIMKGGYDSVIHLAGKSDVRESVGELQAFYTANVTGTFNALETATAAGAKKFIFASSSSVYGDLTREPFVEDDPTDRHVSPYGATKKICEILCNLYNATYGLDTSILRFFTIYGPGGRLNMAVMNFIKLIDEGRTIEVHNFGRNRRDFLFLDDAVDAMELCLERQTQSKPINIGSGEACSLNDLVNLIEGTLGKKANIKYVPMQSGDVVSTRADIARARQILGWKPKTNLKDGIKKTIDWWENGGKNLYK